MRSIMRVVLLTLVLPAFASPALAQGEGADEKVIEQILHEIELLPSLYARNEKPAAPPKFVASKLAGYGLSAKDSVEQNRKHWTAEKAAYAKAFPTRAAFLEAAHEVENLRALRIPLALAMDGAPLPTPKQKKIALQVQSSLGMAIFKLDQIHKKMNDVADWRDKQTLPRWKADFDFAQARVQTNLIFLMECNYTFGQIRADGLSKLMGDEDGWKIVAAAKIRVPEGKAKTLVKDRLKLLKKIQDENPDTPWAYFAERESKRDLGMEWVPKKK
jgi:hypothetical protein